MSAISSTISAVLGSNSLTHVPDFPCWVNLNIDGATGSRDWPLVMVVMRWPWRMESGRSVSNLSASCGLWSKRSNCDGPPFMCR
jgi:hypothetical protein